MEKDASCHRGRDALAFGLPPMPDSPMPPTTNPAAACAPPAPRRLPVAEIVITLVYMTLGAAWVIGTDVIACRLMNEPPQSRWLQTLKGLNFVVTTGILYYLILRRSFHRRRRAEEKARVEQERFELAARAATDTIWDLDVATGRLWWSDGIEKLFGYPVGEVPPTLDFWTDRLHQDDRERVSAGFHRAIEGTTTYWTEDYRFRCHDGRFAFVHDRAFMIRDRTGRALRVVGGMSDITARKEAERRLERSQRQLRALSARLEKSREEERTRIAREIHDELGQLLTALKMDLRWIERKLADADHSPALNPVLDKLVETTELADATLAAVQKISGELRPGVLDHLGLAAALTHEAARFQERTGVTCTVSLPEPTPELSRDSMTTVFRIFQEALTNITRHAEATEVRCELREDGGEILLRIEDNGRGISPTAVDDPKSLGLLGMQERAGVLGGAVRIEPVPPRGTRVTLRLPRGADDSGFWSHL